MKFVLLNGPPRCGKDSAASHICNRHDAIRVGFADHLKIATHAAYGLNYLTHDIFEDVKDQPRDEFFGLTPRQAYIAHSERYMKPLHGPRIFGQLALRRIREFPVDSLVAIPDSGFVEEVAPILMAYGTEKALLIRIHRDGCTFDNDSRSYIGLPVWTVDVENNGSLNDFHRTISRIVQQFAP